MNLDYISPVVTPKYEAEVWSFSRLGNAKTSFTIRGHTAADLIDQFHSIDMAEKERCYDAFLPQHVYVLAELEAQTTKQQTKNGSKR